MQLAGRGLTFALGLRSALAAGFLFPHLGAHHFSRTRLAQEAFLEQFAEAAARIEPIQALGTRLLHLDFETRGAMTHINARGRSVDVLATWATRAHEMFLDVAFEQPARFHAVGQFPFFGLGDSESGHGGHSLGLHPQ